jgi:hypothetical protein
MSFPSQTLFPNHMFPELTLNRMTDGLVMGKIASWMSPNRTWTSLWHFGRNCTRRLSGIGQTLTKILGVFNRTERCKGIQGSSVRRSKELSKLNRKQSGGCQDYSHGTVTWKDTSSKYDWESLLKRLYSIQCDSVILMLISVTNQNEYK